VFLVLESGDQEIELIKGTDSLEEINRKTIACADIESILIQERRSAKKKRINSNMLHGQEPLQILAIQ